MTHFEAYMKQYGLHDTEINKVEVTCDGIEFAFQSGVYVYDPSGKLPEKTEPCRMKLHIHDFDMDRLYEHTVVKHIYKSKIKEIEFSDFLKLLQKDVFRIYLDYYSFFADSILLIGSVQKGEIQIAITEIDRISFDFAVAH